MTLTVFTLGLLFHRQPQNDARAARRGRNREASAVRLGYGPRHGEAEARSFGLGRRERGRLVHVVSWGEAGPVVPDFDQHIVLGRQRDTRLDGPPATDAQHGLRRVDDQIVSRLLKLNPVGANNREPGLDGNREANALLRQILAEERLQLLELGGEIDPVLRQRSLAQKLANAAQHLGRALAFGVDLADRALGEIEVAVLHRLRGDPGIGGQCRQGLVDLMRDGGRHLAGRAHAQGPVYGGLLVAQPGRGVLPLGHDGADNEARDSQRRHQHLQRAETGVRTETDLGADDQAQLDEEQRDRRARRAIAQRDPEQRDEEQVEKLECRCLAVAEHDRQHEKQGQELHHRQGAGRWPGPVRDRQKHQRGDHQDADHISQRGAPGDSDHLALKDRARAQEDQDIERGGDDRRSRGHAAQRQRVAHVAEPGVEGGDALQDKPRHEVGAADREREHEFQAHAEGRAADHGVRQERRDQDEGCVEPSSQEDDGDAEPGRRVPRSDAEPPVRLHEAHVIERHVGREEGQTDEKPVIIAGIGHRICRLPSLFLPARPGAKPFPPLGAQLPWPTAERSPCPNGTIQLHQLIVMKRLLSACVAMGPDRALRGPRAPRCSVKTRRGHIYVLLPIAAGDPNPPSSSPLLRH